MIDATAQPPTEQERVLAEMLAKDPDALSRLDAELWFRKYGVLKTKKGLLIRKPKPTPVQQKMFDAYRKCRAARIPCLMLVLKPRKDGASTGAQAISYHHLRVFEGRNGAQMGDIAGTSDNLFDMFATFAREDKCDWKQGPFDPALDLADSIKLPSGSAYGKFTAGSTNAGRSGTVQVANATEVAYYPKTGDRDPALGYLNSAFLDGEESLAIWDTTPNGPSGVFYNLWQDKTNSWIKIFVAWFENTEHAIAFANEAERDGFSRTLTDDEAEEQTRYGVTLEQLAWRRKTIKDKCEGDVEKFRQEYPSNDIECFLRSSRPKFKADNLQIMLKVAEIVKPVRGELLMQDDGRVSFRPDDRGSVDLWEQPRIGCSYIGAADTCTGEDQQQEGPHSDPDYHSLGIVRAGYRDEATAVFYPPRLVCHHWSRLDADLAALQMASMSVSYGRCIVVPEVNACGLLMVKRLVELEIPVYERKWMNRVQGLLEKAYGWKTDPVTRKTIIDNLAALIREWKPNQPTFELHSVRILQQLIHFIVNEAGKPTAMPGWHDDDVLMLAIAMQNIDLATKMTEVKRRSPTVDVIMRREGWRRWGNGGRR